MSYSPLQNYGAYYGGSSNDQNAQDACNAARSYANSASISASTTEYRTSSTLPQYHLSAYNGPGPSQQSYNTGNRKIKPYGTSGLREINGQQSRQKAYYFERQRNIPDIPSSTASAGQIIHSST